MALAVQPCDTDSIGVDFRIETPGELTSAEARARLTESLRRHVVVRVVSEEPIDPSSISAIARELGDPPSFADAGAASVPGHEIIGDFSGPAKFDDGRPRTPGEGEQLHQDFGAIFRGLASHSILHTREVPPVRAMRWVRSGAVYASLPDALKERIGTLRAIHATGPDRRDGARRPFVLTHPETGEPVLHMPFRRDAAVENLADADSDALMETLFEAIETSPARYERVLEPNDLYVWDNIASFHDNPAFPRDKDRVVWFLTVPCQTKPVAYTRA
jgi:alpha-ketoglutarate-dependent taurine dioxygenase